MSYSMFETYTEALTFATRVGGRIYYSELMAMWEVVWECGGEC